MKIQFAHQGPHAVHGAFARTITQNWHRYGDNYGEILINLIKSTFNNEKFDVILSEGGSGLPYATLMKLKNPKTKVILLNADKFFYLLPRAGFIKKYAMKFLLSYVDGIIAISSLNKRMATPYFPEEKIFIVNSFGVNSNFKLNADVNSTNILFIGDHRVMDKRFDLLVDAFRILNKDTTKFKLYLVGSCSDIVHEEFPWLHKEGIKKNLDAYFKKCSLYVHPADFDPCPVVVFESMSAGLIPIITENTGQSDILKENNLNFLILRNNEPEEIAKKIIEIYENSFEWKKELSIKCKEISSKYNEKDQSNKFKEAFYNLIDYLREY